MAQQASPPPAALSSVDVHVTLACGVLWLLGGFAAIIASDAVERVLEVAGLEALLFAYGSVAALVVAAASFSAAFGLQRGLPWGWKAAVVVYCGWSVLLLPVAAYGIYALMRGRVRAAFVAAPERALLPGWPRHEHTLGPAPPGAPRRARRRPAAQVMMLPAIAGLPGPARTAPVAAEDVASSPQPVASARQPPPPAVVARRTNRCWPAWQIPREPRPVAKVMLLPAVARATWQGP